MYCPPGLLTDSFRFGGLLTLINYLDSILSLCAFLCFTQWKKHKMSSAPNRIVELAEPSKLHCQISAIDSQVYNPVYDLYNLTPDEISIVEKT
jgi:hypothetical protein